MIRCFRDERGFPRADAGRDCASLAEFLEQDVQSGESDCQSLLTVIAEIENGARHQWSATGNAHEIVVTAEKATITNLWIESRSPCALSLAELKKALQEWGLFIKSQPISRS
ncbi:MAG TPA: YacL family protein [Pirellulales bacterium]